MINKKCVYKRVEGCLLEEMGEDALVYNPHTTTTLQLNSSSMLIWRLCDGNHSVEDIIHCLSESFPDAAAHLEQDVNRVITELSDKGVLTRISHKERTLEKGDG